MLSTRSEGHHGLAKKGADATGRVHCHWSGLADQRVVTELTVAIVAPGINTTITGQCQRVIRSSHHLHDGFA